MTEQTENKKMSAKKKALIWVVSIVGVLALTWGTMLYNDYNRVMRQYIKPAFCINPDETYQEYRSLKWWTDMELLERKVAERYIINYGYFQGLGYSVELSGSFLPFFDTTTNHLTETPPPRDEKTNDLLTPWPGVLQARFMLLGKEIARLDRPYPEGAGRTDDWQMHNIF